MADPKQKNTPKKKSNEPKDDEIFTAPEIKREPTSKQVSLGGRLVLRVTAVGKPIPSYQWYLNGKKISGANSDRYMVSKVRREHMGAYHCEVKNWVGKVESREAMVSVIVERIPPLVVEPAEAVMPLGKPFKFTITSVPHDRLKKLSLQWTFNGKRINGAKGPELEFVEVKKKYEGEYKVLLFVGGELRSSNKVTLKVAAGEGAVQAAPVVKAAAPAPVDGDFFFNPEDEADGEVPLTTPDQTPSAAAPLSLSLTEEAHPASVLSIAIPDPSTFLVGGEEPALAPVLGFDHAPSPPDREVLLKKKAFLEKMLRRLEALRADKAISKRAA